MLGSQGLLEDRQRPLMKRLGLGVLALGVIERRQVVEAGGQAWVCGSEFLCFLEASQPRFLCFGVVALLVCFSASGNESLSAILGQFRDRNSGDDENDRDDNHPPVYGFPRNLSG